MTTMLLSPTPTDMLERIFQRLEDESAQRAQEEEQRDRLEAEAKAEGRLTWQEAADELPSPANTSSNNTARERRRTSISVSRYGGQVPDSPTSTHPPSTRPSRSSSLVLTRQNFYQLNARFRQGSADSFASSNGDPAANTGGEDEPSVTQQYVFTPKQSISKAISRRLSRTRDVVPLPSPPYNGSLMVGVAVEEAVVEHRGDDVNWKNKSSKAEVFTGTLRPRRSTPGLHDKLAAANWVSKAKDITSKLRRKSIAALNATSPPISR